MDLHQRIGKFIGEKCVPHYCPEAHSITVDSCSKRALPLIEVEYLTYKDITFKYFSPPKYYRKLL